MWGRIVKLTMSDLLQFTAAEAAFVLQEPIKNVKKALDEGPIRPTLLRKAGASVRAIDWSDLFYLYAVRTLRAELTRKARGEFYEALKHQWGTQADEVRFGRFRVAIADLRREVEQRTRCLAELADQVEFSRDGEALLKGTDIEVYRIAALLDGGVQVELVLADHPAHPRSGPGCQGIRRCSSETGASVPAHHGQARPARGRAGCVGRGAWTRRRSWMKYLLDTNVFREAGKDDPHVNVRAGWMWLMTPTWLSAR